MKLIKIVSPDGKSEVDVHPGRLKQMKDQGWKEFKEPKPQLKEGVNHG